MIDESVSRYRKALRWYPPEWIETYADVVIGAYLDRDDASGLRGPTKADRRELAIAGVRQSVISPWRRGHRLTTTAGSILVACGILATWTSVASAYVFLSLARGGDVNAMSSSWPSYHFVLLSFVAFVAIVLAAVAAIDRRSPARWVGAATAIVMACLFVRWQMIDVGVLPLSWGGGSASGYQHENVFVTGGALFVVSVVTVVLLLQTRFVRGVWRTVIVSSLAISLVTFSLMQSLAFATEMTPQVAGQMFVLSMGRPVAYGLVGFALIFGTSSRRVRPTIKRVVDVPSDSYPARPLGSGGHQPHGAV